MTSFQLYELYAISCKDEVVDKIEEIHLLLVSIMPIQDADLCREYLITHYYFKDPVAVA